MLEQFRRLVTAAQAGDALELDQARVRFAIVSVIVAYSLPWIFWDGIVDDGELAVIALLLALCIATVAHLSWILRRPGVNEVRRRFAPVMDLGFMTAYLLLMGEPGAVLYGVYPWVVIGNGFRYGRWYLHYAQAVAVAGFTMVLCLSEYWRQHLAMGVGLLLVLLAIPLYVSVLVSKLHAAHQRIEEARREAEAANAAKTKFLAAASHDLRQPMQALSMYASILEARVSDIVALRVVRGVQLSVTTLEQLFDSLLDISKIESGVVKPSVVAFPLAPLMDNVVEAERPLAAQKNLELRLVRTAASVRSDPVLLERMLKNLVTNAIRYTELGRIVIGCRRVGDGRLRLEVADSGIGIPAQEQKRIFDEYYQVAGASVQGLGLGLPIVKSLGELLGHKVGVKSAEGRGSVFSIEMERAPEAAVADTGGSPYAALGAANVVVVDDDVEIRNSMSLLLESWGCRCIAGATAGEVEQKLRAQGMMPDALIVDYRLADSMTGLEVIDRLREVFARRLPALLITGTPNASALQQRVKDVPFATKPIPPGKLRAFLSQTLRETMQPALRPAPQRAG